MGTFALGWHVLHDRASAGFGGLLAMLGSPMMLHGLGHLELIYVGLFPLFLIAWMRFLDRPGRGRLVAAVLLYLLMVMGAAYFAVLAVIPAALYVGYGGACVGRGGRAAWWRSRTAWLSLFAALVVPGLSLLFVSQLLGLVRGDPMDRSLADFLRYGVPVWSYVTPTGLHVLARLFPLAAHLPAEFAVVECASYLGVVTIALVLYSAIGRVGFRTAGYWWPVFLILVLLSLGAYVEVGGHRVSLPALWLWKYVFAFRLIRASARFNLLASVFAAVLASAGLKRLLAGIPSRQGRVALYGVLTVLAVADLAFVPYRAATLPAMPACYRILKERDPEMSLLEVPLEISGTCHELNALCGYWQSFHHGRTTGGYSSLSNVSFDNQLVYNSPFSASSMRAPDYLQRPDSATFGILKDVALGDYAWLYMTVHGLKYIVLHQWPGAVPGEGGGVGRFKAQLAGAKIFEDEMTAVYRRDLLKSPARPVLLCTKGWRGGWHGRDRLFLSRRAEVATYNPVPQETLTFRFDAQALRKARTVRLRAGDLEVARWVVEPSELRRYESPPLRLAGGLEHLVIESDGEEQPHQYEAVSREDRRPYSLIVKGIHLGVVDRAGGGQPLALSSPSR
jgi:hypothetical protein